MEIGVNVWVRDTVAIEAWISGTIVGKTENEGETVLSVHCESGAPSLVNFRLKSEHEDNPDLKLRNSADEEHVDNLIKLPFLNEPAILHCLQERYYLGLIYTYTGPILIAVNPFKPVNLYTKSILDEYYNKGLMRSMGADVGTELAPHVYAIADNAYRQMMGAIVRGSSEKIVSEVKVNQSILISGESGAGKTESTKVVLSYLTTVGRGLDATDSFQGSIMEKVLQSNPILEAFGNAKTKRNDNSSRFGKFIQLNFNRRGNLIGGSIKTYLLEKVRLPLQQIGERNFHIFYQLVSGSSEVEKVNRGLRRLEEFNYTSKSGVYILSNVNDAEEYESLCTALSTLNFDTKDQQLLFDIVSGILHLGQLWFQSFTDGEGEGSILDSNPDNQYALQMCTALLGLAPEQLLESLTIKQIVAAGETYFKKLTKIQAADARDALSKAIYGKLFDWLVRTINSRIEVDASNVRANIGVLDIFGFESFAINSFEQLCINYANEALQQQFNQFIFKLEQTEYEKEKIEWHFISFPDNKDCLELIEHRVSGIIAMLDDECRLPKASDEKFAARSYKEYATNPRFSASAPQKRSGKFSIHHYAGQVEYTVATFVEKNKDELPKEANSLLQSSTNRLLNLLFRPEVVDVTMDSHLAMHPGKRKPVTVSNVVQSVGSQFKDQLNDLMSTIYTTSPHYIRCLKPNDQNVPDTFTRLRITEQLRYGGVLEAVRVARSGFPVRLSHEEFYRRYRMLVFARLRDTPHDSPAAYKAFCVAFVNAIAEVRRSSVCELSSKLEKYAFDFRAKIRMDGFQVGLTKLFLRKECHDYLETSRYRCIHLASVRMQAWHRANRSRLWFRSATYAARLIQRCVRGNKARQLTLGLRRNRAALIIQKHARCFICRRHFNSYLYAVTLLQAHLRRRRQRNLFVQNRRKHAGHILMRALQLYLHRCCFLRIRKAITILKGKMRVSKAKILLRQLRLEAKDLGRLQENNETLKKEIEELKSRAAEERQRLQQEFERRAQETLMAANKVELETLRTRLQEAEQLLHEEKQHGKEKEKKLQQSLQDSHPAAVSASQEGNALCWKCRERRIDDDPLLPSPVMHSPNEAPARRRSSRRLFAGELRIVLSPETISPPGKHHQSSIGTAANKVHIEDFKQANERLQGEVTRLRGTNIEHLATIENLRREMQLMKEEEDKLRQELAKMRPLDHLAQRQRRGSLKVLRDISADRTKPQQSSENAREDQPITSATASAPTTSWINTWDAEDDDNTSESRSVQDVSSAYSNASSSVIASVESAALQSVEKNLDKWKAELIKGVKAVLWEGQKVVQADVTVKLDTAGTAIQFINVQQRRAFGLFNNKVEVAPLRLSDISECLPGAELKIDGDPKLLLTIICKDQRLVVLKFSTRDERNIMLSKIRAIFAAASVHMGLSAMKPHHSIVHVPTSIPATSIAVPSAVSTTTSQSIPGFEANPLYLQRMARRPSVRETVINKSLQSASGGTADLTSSVSSGSSNNTHTANTHHFNPTTNDDAVSALSVRVLQKSLQEEKDTLHKTKLQMVLMNNDLAEKDETISYLRKNLQEFELKLKEKDNLMKQDTMVRLQLGKRLEQVLIDKEEALEQLEQLRAQLDMISRT